MEREEVLDFRCFRIKFSSYTKSPSPDGNGILFLFSLKRKRYSEQLEIAPQKTTQLSE